MQGRESLADASSQAAGHGALEGVPKDAIWLDMDGGQVPGGRVPDGLVVTGRRKAFFQTCALSLALSLLTVIGLGGITGNGLITLDDRAYIQENRQVLRGITPEGFRWAFTTTSQANWHPLTWISHQCDAQLFGVSPAGHHLVNLLFHLANTVLLFVAFSLMTGSLLPSAVTAALFAVHPLHVESVAWASERKDVLSTCLVIFAILAYLKYVRRPAPTRLLPVTFFFTLALLAKPMAVTLPFLLLVLDFWPLGRWIPARGSSLRPLLPPLRLWREKIPLFVLSACSAAITFAVQMHAGVLSSGELLPFGHRAVNALTSYVRYLGKIVWPHQLSVFYPHPGTEWSWVRLAGALLVLLAICTIALLSRTRRPFLLAGWLWYLGTLLPVIGLVQSGSQSMADRYTYIPIVGVFLAVTWAAAELVARRPGMRPALAIACLGLLAVLTVRTRHQAALWRDDDTLFNHAMQIDPGNWMAHNAFGSLRLAQGDPEGAVRHYREALRQNPENPYELTKLGMALVAAHQEQEAIDCFRRALVQDAGYLPARQSLGAALAARGARTEAIAQYREALRLDPRSASVRNDLGEVLSRLGRHDEALSQYQEALRSDPADPDVLVNLGNALSALGRADEALASYREAVRAAPEHAKARYNLGVALAERGDAAGAAASFREAIRLDPQSADAHNNLGLILAAGRRHEEAAAEYRLVIAIDPRHALAHNNLGAVFAAQGRTGEAEAQFRRALEIEPDLAEARLNLSRLMGGAAGRDTR